MGVDVRLATPSDSEACAAIWALCWPSSPWRGGYHLREARRFVAEVEGVVVGFAESFPGMLQWLCVAPAHRRQGVGTALVDAVADDMRSRCSRSLGVWVTSDTAALAFYHALGFAPTGATHAEKIAGEMTQLLFHALPLGDAP